MPLCVLLNCLAGEGAGPLDGLLACMTLANTRMGAAHPLLASE